jgi:hypothetical protein
VFKRLKNITITTIPALFVLTAFLRGQRTGSFLLAALLVGSRTIMKHPQFVNGNDVKKYVLLRASKQTVSF